MKTLTIIRHSLTEGNVRHLYYGWADIPLCKEGRELCARLRGSIVPEEGTVFAHTGMVRTKETLTALFGDVPALVFPDLKEMDMGRLEMRGYEDVKDDADYRAWCDDTTGEMPIPGGTESVNAFRKRILTGLDAVMRRSEEHMLLVAHGGTIGHAMPVWFPAEGKHFYQWIPSACEGYRLFIEDGRPARYEKV